MSSYVRWYNNRKDFYKIFAERWVAWAEGAELSTMEVEGMSKFFRCIAKRFGLIQEFSDLGVI